MKSNEIRKNFIKFFKDKNHEHLESSNLIPKNDNSLLFVNSGMVRFKEKFINNDKKNYVTIQKCVRAGGKHNDLDNIGYTARHHTFFEMLGNFSFGGYGSSTEETKKIAIEMAWDFLTAILKIDKNRLYITVYKDDDEAYKIWNTLLTDENKLIKIGDKEDGSSDNFWSMGDTGPCGPSTEIFYDYGDEVLGDLPGSEDEGDRYVEIWNIVFTQYNKKKDGTLENLKGVCIDTGMGLERISSVLQNKIDNYNSDLFMPIIKEIGLIKNDNQKIDPVSKIISDHIRCSIMLISDGCLPSNDGRGYILKKIIRRFLRYKYRENIDVNLISVVKVAINCLKEEYPDIIRAEKLIINVITNEIKTYVETLEKGKKEIIKKVNNAIKSEKYFEEYMALIKDSTSYLLNNLEYINSYTKNLDKYINKANKEINIKEVLSILDTLDNSSYSEELLKKIKETVDIIKVLLINYDICIILGNISFEMYDTFGIDFEDFLYILKDKFDIYNDLFDENIILKTYDQNMKQQIEMGKISWKNNSSDNETNTNDLYSNFKETIINLDVNCLNATILGIIKDGEIIKQCTKDDTVSVILDQTNFYSESGGQIGDSGKLYNRDGECIFNIIDVQKTNNVVIHKGKVLNDFNENELIKTELDREKRNAISRNHSATHLLHFVLRSTLGTHVTQRGSLVDDQKLRFDFSHSEKLTENILRLVEEKINSFILENTALSIEVMDKDEALKKGAMALFGEKYTTKVRVVSMPEVFNNDNACIELCGGTHVKRTGDIGLFKIISEESIGSGCRRIEAITGMKVYEFLSNIISDKIEIMNKLKVNNDSLVTKKISDILEENKNNVLKLKETRKQMIINNQCQKFRTIDNEDLILINVKDHSGKEIREIISEQIKYKTNTIIISIIVDQDKVTLITGITKDINRISIDITNDIISKIGGQCKGGKKELAQAGISNKTKSGDISEKDILEYFKAK